MRMVLLSTLALGAFTSAAMADEVILAPDQMDKVTAGAPPELFFVDGSAGSIRPGPDNRVSDSPAFFLPNDEDIRIVITPGAATGVTTGGQSSFRGP
jgi:hypothetical protein